MQSVSNREQQKSVSIKVDEKKFGFLMPHENTNANYGKTRVQLYLHDKEKIAKLEKKLNLRMEYMIKKEVDNLRQQGKESKSLFGSTTWSMPSHLVCFLQGLIEHIDGQKLKI